MERDLLTPVHASRFFGVVQSTTGRQDLKIRWHLQVPGARTSTYFGGEAIQPTAPPIAHIPGKSLSSIAIEEPNAQVRNLEPKLGFGPEVIEILGGNDPQIPKLQSSPLCWLPARSYKSHLGAADSFALGEIDWLFLFMQSRVNILFWNNGLKIKGLL